MSWSCLLSSAAPIWCPARRLFLEQSLRYAKCPGAPLQALFVHLTAHTQSLSGRHTRVEESRVLKVQELPQQLGLFEYDQHSHLRL